MNWKSLFLSGALLITPMLLYPQSAFAQTAEKPKAEPTKIPKEAAKEAGTVEARPALWVVRDEDTTIYLFGTIHLLKPELRWFEGPIRAAFDESQEVVLEVAERDEKASQNLMMVRALALDGLPLSNRLDETTREAYFATLKKHGVSPILFDRVKPWFAALTITVLPLQSLGYSPESGVDRAIQAEAVKAGKTLIGLETAEEQIGFFEQLPEAVQLTLLKETIAELPKIPDTIERMLGAWGAADVDTLARLLNETTEQSAEIERILLSDRNARWAEWIEDRMSRPGTVFMAVGAGHLAGDKSVQRMLTDRGLNATSVAW